MLRQTCSISPPEWKPPDLEEAITLRLQTITPMFGGGYEPREVDPLCVIRPATIRGHLRFWWRATTGAQYASAEKLFEDEEKLWGSTKVPGQIAIAVTIDDVGQMRQTSQVANPRSSPRDGPQHGYFTWPFQEQRGEGVPEAECREKVRFTL
ncbi:MAG TPA: type III-B CRISPR module RAMP protein Cmr1, partial [Chthonomonadales bacterium]|nr:type III-B CRISPR module RAMP protein Cmr1 [Chthonomonadales bacterium]